jgi:hypothetical protein
MIFQRKNFSFPTKKSGINLSFCFVFRWIYSTLNASFIDTKSELKVLGHLYLHFFFFFF